jgi:hypothetical protein
MKKGEHMSKSGRQVLGIPNYLAIRCMLPGFIVIVFLSIAFTITDTTLNINFVEIGAISYAILVLALALSIGLALQFSGYIIYTLWRKCIKNKIFKAKPEEADCIITVSRKHMVKNYTIMHNNVQRNFDLAGGALNSTLGLLICTIVYPIIVEIVDVTKYWLLVIIAIVIALLSIYFIKRMFETAYTTINDYYKYIVNNNDACEENKIIIS